MCASSNLYISMTPANVLAKEVAGDLWGRDVSFIWTIKSLTSWNYTQGNTAFIYTSAGLLHVWYVTTWLCRMMNNFWNYVAVLWFQSSVALYWHLCFLLHIYSSGVFVWLVDECSLYFLILWAQRILSATPWQLFDSKNDLWSIMLFLLKCVELALRFSFVFYCQPLKTK